MHLQALEILKARIGLTTKARDEYLEHIIKSIKKEIEDDEGIDLDYENPHHLMFIVDFADWRYSNRDSEKGMPRHLKYRLHKLILKKVTENE